MTLRNSLWLNTRKFQGLVTLPGRFICLLNQTTLRFVWLELYRSIDPGRGPDSYLLTSWFHSFDLLSPSQVRLCQDGWGKLHVCSKKALLVYLLVTPPGVLLHQRQHRRVSLWSLFSSQQLGPHLRHSRSFTWDTWQRGGCNSCTCCFAWVTALREHVYSLPWDS